MDGLSALSNPSSDDTEGRKITSKYIADSGWDIVGVAEDFNYHDEFVSTAGDYYNFGTHRGGTLTWKAILSAIRVPIDTDGLGIAVAKKLTLGGETWKAWTDANGYLADGWDEHIVKGFRMYTVTFATGVAVDVYVLHMDAETSDADIAARESQLTQLATYIKNNHNNRPVIIMGDTNCRYTRDKLKELFIDVINADERLTIKDAWVELIYDGEYPAYDTDAMMTHTLGANKGEVVDKVFYINTTESDLVLRANTYQNDAANLSISDHTPVMVSFTIKDPDGTPLDNSLSGPGVAVDDTWTDAAPVSPTQSITGKQYYMRNEASGLFFKACNNWGSHFGEGRDGLPVQMALVSDNIYKLSTPTLGRYVGNNYFADNGDANAGNWVVEEIKSTNGDGDVKYKYVFRNSSDTNMSIASKGDDSYVDGVSYDAGDPAQQWVLYTYDEMIAAIKEEMAATISGAYYNASGLITQPMCNLALDSRHSAWTKTSTASKGIEIGGGASDETGNTVWEVFREAANSGSDYSSKFSMSQSLTGLPNGTYTIRVQALYRHGDAYNPDEIVRPQLFATYIYKSGNRTYSQTDTKDVISILNQPYSSAPLWWSGDWQVTKNDKGYIPSSMYAANKWFKDGHYVTEISDVEVIDKKLTIGIRNTNNDYNTITWCCFDNFQLIWHGTAEGNMNESDVYREIKTAAEEAYASLPEAAKKYFDISDVKWRYDKEMVSEDGSVELGWIEEAVEAAIKAQLGDVTPGEEVDMSMIIKNHSFERGNLYGWSVNNANDTGVKLNSNAVYTTTGTDGSYLFNNYANGDVDNCYPLKQTVSAVKNGYYELTASVTSFSGKTVYLVANDQYNGTSEFTDKTSFVDVTVKFLIEDGTLNIATVGSDNGEFNYPRGSFFRADNYRLIYKGTIGQGRKEIALADADKKIAKLTHQPAKDKYENAVASIRTKTVEGNGKTEVAAIYAALAEAIKHEPRRSTEMTWLIENPSFEKTSYTGWTTTTGWDTRVVRQSSGEYAHYADGLYLFNTWNNHADAEKTGKNQPIYQVVSGLPNGEYTLTAKVASDAGNKIFLAAKGGDYSTKAADYKTSSVTIAEGKGANEMFEVPAVTFNVTNNKATIMVAGANNGNFNVADGCWYKADDFRLTYNHHKLQLKQTEKASEVSDWYTDVDLIRPIKSGTWNSFVVPYDMSVPEKWDVRELTGITINGTHLSLSFTRVDVDKKMVAGTPYMVRYYPQGVPADPTVNVNDDNDPSNDDPADKVEYESKKGKGTIFTEYVTVDTKGKVDGAFEGPTVVGDGGSLKFMGSYLAEETIPIGSVFIKDNLFYISAGNNKIRGYRGYFTPGEGAVYARTFGMRSGDTTGVDTPNNEDVTVVAIYNLNGVRLAEVQDGVNILQMSDGTTIKVIME